MYAQFDENGVCRTIGTPNVTGIEATYENLGQMYVDGEWVEVEGTEEDIEVKMAELQSELDELTEKLNEKQGGEGFELGESEENK
ncbi:MAG: hypothetical protein ACOX4U_00395 [Anaerovoracaceae bacterium]|jgi:hypothetical protein